jgi:hypothetical protein
MFRFRLRTLLIVLTLGPPLIALAWWYGKTAIGLMLLALLFCPDLLFLAGQGAWALFGWLSKASKRLDPDENRSPMPSR